MQFQPIIDLHTGATVGFEALARDDRTGRPEPPAQLFAEAAAAGRTVELDWACRTAALRAAGTARLAGAALFVNADPQAAGTEPTAAYLQAELDLPRQLVRVLEITERTLALRPGPLLTMVDAARSAGWRIALDDVGALWSSLSLLPFLQPDVIKLDLALVQRKADVHAAEVVNAVAVQCAATGALLLAEGIETTAHADLARSMGARLGQGFLFGRPAALPGPPGPSTAPDLPESPVRPGTPQVMWPRLSRPDLPQTPWRQLPPDAPVRRAAKPLLVGIARWLERQALALGEAAVVLAAFERAEHFTAATARRYATLARSGSIVGVLAQHLPEDPAPGVRGARLSADDPLCDEWNVIVVGPHFTGALLAHDLGDVGPDASRRFDYLVTYDRQTVLAAAADLLRRLPDVPLSPMWDSLGRGAGAPDSGRALLAPPPQPPAAAPPHSPPHSPPHPPADRPHDLPPLLASALAASDHGLTVSDARAPDLPLVYVNPAFERLSGHPAAALLGRNPRFLQDTDTDAETVRALRTAVRTGREVQVTVLNARPDGTRWWNELHLVPVNDASGTLTHWVGTQHDITERINHEQQIAYLAHHDPLTGLANRRRLVEHLPAELGRAGRTGTSVALLYLDLDRFKAMNDTYGHPVGDQLLLEVAVRLRLHRRVGDLLVRQGGDEFLLVLSGLPHDAEDARHAAQRVADKLREEFHRPFQLQDDLPPVRTTTSIGISLYPHDAQDAAHMIDHADRALYEVKAHGRDGSHVYGHALRPQPVPADAPR